jgi:hypothetical protein
LPLQRPCCRRKHNTVTIAAAAVDTVAVQPTTMGVIEEAAEAAEAVAFLSARCWVLLRVQQLRGPRRRHPRLSCIRHRHLRLRRARLITRIAIRPAIEAGDLADRSLAGSTTLTRPDKTSRIQQLNQNFPT